MRKLTLSLAVSGVAAAAFLAPIARACFSSSDRLVVHEWGTFTSFSGSDGIRLEFRPLVGDDLPPFVLDRFLQAGVGGPPTKATIRARLRMETPVTYFYTDRERDVDVKVEFPKGLLTEFYPPVEHFAPDFELMKPVPLRASRLDWGKVHLIPADRFVAHVDDPARRRLLEARMLNGLLPTSGEGEHYFFARETDSAVVQVSRPPQVGDARNQRPFAPEGEFFEKFLFYRGIGDSPLPIQATCAGDGRIELENRGPDAIGSLFILDVPPPPAGNEKSDAAAELPMRFAKLPPLAASSRVAVALPDDSGSPEELANELVSALAGEGLYEKEARAMVKTWQSSWFSEAGTRLLYIVPRRLTDELIPLEVRPTPDETVRVLVGRLEVLTPEAEARAADLVRQSAQEREVEKLAAREQDRPSAYQAAPKLAALGRLAEPALVRLSATSGDAAIRAEARKILAELGVTSRRGS
jgi:hypothetical protein